MRGRKGKFEHADGGTLFLDEVGDLSASAQAKLLRALQDLSVERVGGQGVRRIDTRVVAATNKRLASLVEAGLFRADLYYRLAGLDVHVPPLRERRKTSSSWRPIFSSGIAPLATWSSRGRRPTPCRLTTGRAMCASSSG